MNLICGLGNPGLKYANTRHNVGFMAIDKFANLLNLEWEKKNESLVATSNSIILVKPLTFMNKSGVALKKIISLYKIPVSSLWIIHDDLDISLGEYKIQQGRGPKVHNGVNSIESELGTSGFWRVRIGIENRGEDREAGEAYVLSNFADEERLILDQTLSKSLSDLETKLV